MMRSGWPRFREQAPPWAESRIGGDQLGMELAEELQRLAPFGNGNPGVTLLVADAIFRDVRPMGEGKHARFTVESCGARSRGVAFRTGGRLPVDEGAAAEATFTLEVNEWNGVTEPRLVLRHARPSEQPSEQQERPTEPPAAGEEDRAHEELTLFALS